MPIMILSSKIISLLVNLSAGSATGSEKMARKQFQQAKTGELVSRLNVFHEMSERNHVSSF